MNLITKLFTGLALTVCATSFYSCKETIDTLEPYKDIAFIWAYLDKSDTAHYIVIQKAFVNTNVDANTLVQYPDSIYFSNLDVKVEEYNNTTLVNTYTLQKVNLQTEGYVKDTGLFQNQVNYAYKFKANLSPLYTYRVVATKDNKKFMASTPLLNVDSNTLNVYNYYWRGGSDSMRIIPDQNLILIWNRGNGGEVYSANVEFDYYDVSTSAPNDSIKHTIKWNILDNLKDKNGGQKSLNVPSNLFYAFIATSMPDAPSNVSRYIGSPRFVMYAGSSRLTKYLDMKEAQSGLSSSQVNPVFRDGFLTDDTYGLFDTRGTARYKLTLADTTMYYLKYKQELASKRIMGRK